MRTITTGDIISGTVTMDDLDDEAKEVYLRESLALRLTEQTERYRLSLRAAAMDQWKRTGAKERCGLRWNRKRYGAQGLEIPANAAELGAAAMAEACRVCGVAPEDWYEVSNARARWFAVVAIAYIPSDHSGCRKGLVGPMRAQKILGLGNAKTTTYERELSTAFPVLAMRARTFGATMRATWKTP